jgi:hypothetical protein
VATSHYLVRAMWAMLKRGTYWQENPAHAQLTPARALQQQGGPPCLGFLSRASPRA